MRKIFNRDTGVLWGTVLCFIGIEIFLLVSIIIYEPMDDSESFPRDLYYLSLMSIIGILLIISAIQLTFKVRRRLTN